MSSPLTEVRNQLIAGDQSYIENLFEETYDYATSYLKKKKYASEDEAHDLYIDAVMILRERIIDGNLPEIKNVKSFIVGICINLNKEFLYKKYRAESKELEVRELFYSKGFVIDEEYAEDQETLKKICLQAMDTLGEKCQKLLNMYHFEGLNMTEIADVLGFASSNVAKTMKSRCFKKLIKTANKLRTLTK